VRAAATPLFNTLWLSALAGVMTCFESRAQESADRGVDLTILTGQSNREILRIVN
jgi:hypothetical protein